MQDEKSHQVCLVPSSELDRTLVNLGASMRETNSGQGMVFNVYTVSFCIQKAGESGSMVKVTAGGYPHPDNFRARESACLRAIEELRSNNIHVVDYNHFVVLESQAKADDVERLLMHSKGIFWSLLSDALTEIGKFYPVSDHPEGKCTIPNAVAKGLKNICVKYTDDLKTCSLHVHAFEVSSMEDEIRKEQQMEEEQTDDSICFLHGLQDEMVSICDHLHSHSH